MLSGPELAAALVEAMTQKDVGTNELARHFGIKSPSVSEWRRTGNIGKDKIAGLIEYFSDVVGPEHWGLTQLSNIGSPARDKSLVAVGADNPSPTEQPHPLVSKLAAAIRAGHLSATALDMLEAALDSQLVKAAKPAGSNVAVPPPSVLLELRTAQLATDAGTATPESINAMNQRIRSRSNAERNRAQSSVVGDGERRNKKDR